MDEFKDEWYAVDANQGNEIQVPTSPDDSETGSDYRYLKVHIDSLLNTVSNHVLLTFL